MRRGTVDGGSFHKRRYSHEQEAFQRRLDELSGELGRLREGKFFGVNFVFRCGVYRLGEEECSIDMACDRANYAKDMPQNNFETTFVFYDKLIRSHIMDEKWLESSMRSGLERGEFRPYYQPKVNAVTGAVVGAEALIRWHHPERGTVFPEDFLAMAENSGLIIPLGEFALEEVCDQISRWQSPACPAAPSPHR